MKLRVNQLILAKQQLNKVNSQILDIRTYNLVHQTNYQHLTKKQSSTNEYLELAPLQAAKSHLVAKTRKLTNAIKFNRDNHLVSPIFA